MTDDIFNLRACADAAEAGDLQGWVLRYLSSGYWANPGMHDGLLLHRRYWLGPCRVSIERLERCCGPEDGMAYHVPLESWQGRVAQLVDTLESAESLPPLIVEWCGGRLMIRDGNHRSDAMIRKGWVSCFIVLWCNSNGDHRQAAAALNIDITRR